MNFTIYKGESQLLPGAQIEAIVSPTSANVKTGPISQVWMLVADKVPSAAVKDGSDEAVCGNCELRGGVCYVNTVRMGPNAVFRGKRRDFNFVKNTWSAQTRLGAYGDPTAVPRPVWDMFTHRHNLGYTRQWRTHPEFSDICMASVFTETEREEAKSLGFRTYRIGHEKTAGEMFCPWPKVTCMECKLCDGARMAKKKDIVIPVHGTAYKHRNFEKLELK